MKTHNYKVFKCFSRKFKIGGVEPPPYVKLIFAKYSGGGTHMGPAQFRRFLAEVQGQEGCTVADAERVMEEVARRRHNHIGLTEHQSCALTLDDFFHYLLSDDLNQAIKTQVLVFSIFRNSRPVLLFASWENTRKRKEKKRISWLLI